MHVCCENLHISGSWMVLTLCLDQIRFILLQNRQGKTRLAKYYIPLEDSEKHKLEYEVSISTGPDLDVAASDWYAAEFDWNVAASEFGM